MDKNEITEKVYEFSVELKLRICLQNPHSTKQRKNDLDAEQIARKSFEGMSIVKEHLKDMTGGFIEERELEEDWNWDTFEKDKLEKWLNKP